MSEELRLDIWLWRARFFKTRALATAHVTGKGVRLSRNGQLRKVTKPGFRILPGDIVSFPRGGQIVSVRVLDHGERRGPASEARELYEDLAINDQERHDA
ncbi:RNA-binding S4 domain-containing protein [Thalassovita mediterranea]|nr:RNA-binding S4 domain-containing protein [Thalassovita mediterranea]